MRSVPLLALAAAAILIVILGGRISDLKAQHGELRRTLSVLRPGEFVPAFTATRATGEDVRVGEGIEEEKQVIFLMSVDCPFSLASVPAWISLMDRVAEAGVGRIRPLVLSVDEPGRMESFVERLDVPLPLAAFPDLRHRMLFKPARLPQILIIGHDGRVRYVRVGVLDRPAAVDSVFTALVGVMSANPPPEEAS